MNLTDWFPGSTQPVREGVYQRMYSKNLKDIRYCFWDGDWRVGRTELHNAWVCRTGFAHDQSLPWRGIHK